MANSEQNKEALQRAADGIRAAEVPLQRLEERLRSGPVDDEDLQDCLASIERARHSVQGLSVQLKLYMARELATDTDAPIK